MQVLVKTYCPDWCLRWEIFTGFVENVIVQQLCLRVPVVFCTRKLHGYILLCRLLQYGTRTGFSFFSFDLSSVLSFMSSCLKYYCFRAHLSPGRLFRDLRHKNITPLVWNSLNQGKGDTFLEESPQPIAFLCSNHSALVCKDVRRHIKQGKTCAAKGVGRVFHTKT